MSNDAIMVERGIPVPAKAVSPGRPTKYPWHSVEVGDSFFVPGMSTCKSQPDGRRRFACNNGEKWVSGSKWTMRNATKDGVQGVRVWRVK